MEVYLAYFDILGFKEYIYNTSEEDVDFKFECLFRDSQSSITGDNLIEDSYGGLVPDLKIHAKTNCIHVSDSIIFYTNDSSKDSFIKIVEVCNDFFQSCCVHQTFPVRGCLVKGNISFAPFTIAKQGILSNNSFINSSLYGKALIEAYLKAESQDWAGCFVDKTAYSNIEKPIIDELIKNGLLLNYNVPFKNSTSNELTIKMIGPKRDNIKEVDVQNLFTQLMNGKEIHESVQKKIDNTLAYFKYIKLL